MRIAAALALGAALFVLPVASQNKSAISGHARRLHFSSIVVDTHDDTTQRLYWEHFDLATRSNVGQIDIPRMRQGGLSAIFFSIWSPGTLTGGAGVQRALDLIDSVREQVRRHPRDLALAGTAADVRRAHTVGKIAVLMGLEGGHMIADDLGVLRLYYSLGVRYMTLTHEIDTDWADSSTDKPIHNGLTPFGKQVVLEMNRLGMLVDISHVSDKTFWDAIATSKAPMIASHSSCRALCDAPRNMTDDMIKALATHGGVIQINYHVGFLSQAYRNAANKIAPEIAAADKKADQACGKDLACEVYAEARVSDQLTREGKLPVVGWEEIVKHIDHAVKLVGADHVGLGSDFDGSILPAGMQDATHLPQITQALLDRGYSDADIQKILGGNTLRVLERAEAVSREMQAAGEK
ncbi:MAG TPA: dipeptidase [Candidatus Acidoferrales bacterium]|nr:dipeptidase [Candidatus Acidoferrales bacterium]